MPEYLPGIGTTRAVGSEILSGAGIGAGCTISSSSCPEPGRGSSTISVVSVCSLRRTGRLDGSSASISQNRSSSSSLLCRSVCFGSISPTPFRLCSPNILLYHVSSRLSIGFWKKQSAPDPLILCGPEAEHMYEVRSAAQRCTLPLALPFASDSTSLAVSGLLSPSTECFRQLAAAAKDTASCVEKPSRSA